jgi:hypothetical protein
MHVGFYLYIDCDLQHYVREFLDEEWATSHHETLQKPIRLRSICVINVLQNTLVSLIQ